MVSKESKRFRGVFFLHGVIALCSLCSAELRLDLEEGRPTPFELFGERTLALVLNLPGLFEPESECWIFQAHSFYRPVILSLSPEPPEESAQDNSSDISLAVRSHRVGSGDGTAVTVYLHTFSMEWTMGMVMVVGYGSNGPIPGMAANSISSTLSEVANPQLAVTVDVDVISLTFFEAGALDVSETNYRYRVYQAWDCTDFFTVEDHAADVGFMMTSNTMEMEAHAVSDVYLQRLSDRQLRVIFPTYESCSRVFGAIVDDIDEVTGEVRASATYSPVFVHRCHISPDVDAGIQYPFVDCRVKLTSTPPLLALLVVVGVTGIWIGLFGHVFFRKTHHVINIGLSMVLGYPLICYLLPSIPSDQHSIVFYFMMIPCFGGTASIFLWQLVRKDCWAVLPSAFLASIVLGITGLYFCGQLQTRLFVSDLAYFGTIVIVMLGALLLLIPYVNMANLVYCAVIGSAFLTVPVAFSMNSTLRYAVLNFWRRIYYDGFGQACTVMSYGDQDFIVGGFFFAFLASSLFCQFLCVCDVNFTVIAPPLDGPLHFRRIFRGLQAGQNNEYAQLSDDDGELLVSWLSSRRNTTRVIVPEVPRGLVVDAGQFTDFAPRLSGEEDRRRAFASIFGPHGPHSDSRHDSPEQSECTGDCGSLTS